MRRFSTLAVLAGAAGVLVVAPPTGARTGQRLPTAITVDAGKVAYRINRGEHVSRVAPLRWPYPKDAACCAAPGVWFAIRQHQLVIGRDRRTLWRSRGRFASRLSLGTVRVGSNRLAFTYGNDLYLAALGGGERVIGHAELPLGFTGAGFYTYRWGGDLLLRGDTGAVLKRIGRPLGRSTYAVVNDRLYFLTRTAVMAAQGASVWQLASLHGLGLSARSLWFQAAGSLLQVQEARRLVLLRGDGSVFASALLPRAHGQTESISSSLAFAPAGDAVAFAADAQPARSTYGSETVYLLRAGAHAATPVHRARVNFAGCVRWAMLAWHGRWLLYGNTERVLAVIDTAGAGSVIELGRLVRRLPGTKNGFSAYWTGQPPPM